MKKDWGFSALVEVAGKRILFDTGNDRDIFAANIKAKGIDLANLDFVVMSHRHSVCATFMRASARHSRWDRAWTPASEEVRRRRSMRTT
jgi:glyoxylase-like metal-dependent hydrolase (beta-lactamase superfamily II)